MVDARRDRPDRRCGAAARGEEDTPWMSTAATRQGLSRGGVVQKLPEVDVLPDAGVATTLLLPGSQTRSWAGLVSLRLMHFHSREVLAGIENVPVQVG